MLGRCDVSNTDCAFHLVHNTTHKYWLCSLNDTCASAADSDIAGLGILCAFLATASLTLIVAWFVFFFDEGDDDTPLAVLDQQIFQFLWKWNRHRAPETEEQLVRRKSISLMFQKFILNFSDAHLATGIAIVIAGYTLACELSIYHFHTVVYLAWISSSVHIVTLVMSVSHLKAQGRWLWCRVVAMTILFCLLFVDLCLLASSTIPLHGTAYSNGAKYYNFDQNISCTWTLENLKSWSPDVVSALALLVFGFVLRLVKILVPGSATTRLDNWASGLLNGFVVACQRRKRHSRRRAPRLIWSCLIWMAYATYMHTRAIVDVYRSNLLALVWATLSLWYGGTDIYTWRRLAPQPLREAEAQWTFGQILALMLLVGPLISTPQIITESREEAEKLQRRVIDTDNGDKPLRNDSDTVDEATLVLEPSNTTHTKIHVVAGSAGGARYLSLSDPASVYQSFLFRILVGLIVACLTTIFVILTLVKLHGLARVLKPFHDHGSDNITFGGLQTWAYKGLFVVFLPELVVPSILWFCFMAPFSRTLNNTVRYGIGIRSRLGASGEREDQETYDGRRSSDCGVDSEDYNHHILLEQGTAYKAAAGSMVVHNVQEVHEDHDTAEVA